jgi:hypothetical protein
VKSATKAKQTEEGNNRMKIELKYTMWEGCWQECALCGEGFRSYEVEAHTKPPGEGGERPVCRGCVLTGEQLLKQRLSFRVRELRRLADRLEQACEEGIMVPSIDDIHNLERRRAGRVRTDLWGSDEP